jgi:hypothetical protein
MERLYFRSSPIKKKFYEQTGISRNTVGSWLRPEIVGNPDTAARGRKANSCLQRTLLSLWLKIDMDRNKRKHFRADVTALCGWATHQRLLAASAHCPAYEDQEGLAAAKGLSTLKFRRGRNLPV